MDWVEAKTAAGRVMVDPAIGNIRRLDFRVGDRTLSPLHTALWADAPEYVGDPSVLPVEARLAGDFFCAPFGPGDLDASPAHGWTANSPWTLLDQLGDRLRLRLGRSVMGAKITKTLTLAGDAPLLYQTHVFEGGTGRLPVAHHPMICLAGKGLLSTSPKRAALTPATPLEPGRHRLAPGARSEDISRFPAGDGGTLNLRDLPIGTRHEDFVTLVEAPGARLGWTAVVREAEDDIVFFLKNPSVLPVTMLWHSNGGRDYAPWNGHHSGVLGIEDGCAAGADGHRAALDPNPVAAEGVSTALTLGQDVRIAHVLGAIPRPDGWASIREIAAQDGQLTLTETSGATQALPFDTDFLTKDS